MVLQSLKEVTDNMVFHSISFHFISLLFFLLVI